MQKHRLQGLTKYERAVFRTLCGRNPHRIATTDGSPFQRTGRVQRGSRTFAALAQRLVANGYFVALVRGLALATPAALRHAMRQGRDPIDFAPTAATRALADHLWPAPAAHF